MIIIEIRTSLILGYAGADAVEISAGGPVTRCFSAERGQKMTAVNKMTGFDLKAS